VITWVEMENILLKYIQINKMVKTAKEKKIDSLIERAVKLDKQLSKIKDKIWSLDEQAGEELNEMLMRTN